MEIIDRIVDFSEHCYTCKHIHLNEDEEPCRECLDSPTNVYSEKPIKWEDGGEKQKVEETEKGS